MRLLWLHSAAYTHTHVFIYLEPRTLKRKWHEMIRAERTISTHFQSILYRKKPGKLLFLRCYKSCRYCKLYILNCVLINIPTETRNQFIPNMIKWEFLYDFQSLDYIFGNEIIFYTQRYNDTISGFAFIVYPDGPNYCTLYFDITIMS